MNWIVALIIGLIVGWFLEALIDWFYWRNREVEGTANVDCSQISADYEKEINGLNLSLNDYKSNIETKDVEISGLTASLSAKDRELADLTASYASMEANLDVKDREVADLSASLDTKNVELSGLSASLSAKDAEAEGLRGRLLGNIKSPGWFDWGEYDFFNWGEGDDVEFVGSGEAGETVDITYGRETIGTAEVDSTGGWKLPWAVPAAFLPGMLGFIRRDSDGAEVEASRGDMSAAIDGVAPIFPDFDDIDVDADTDVDIAVESSIPDVDTSLPSVEVEASVPDVDIDVDANARGGWFNWPDWDFSGWGAGEDHELSGVGDPGGSVDINYDGEYRGTAQVGDDGKWSFPFKVPAMFAAGGLGFLARDRDGAEVEIHSVDVDVDLPSAELDVDASLPDVEVEVPSANIDVDASLPEVDTNARGGWFNWPDWDFSGWGEGEERELSGIGEPGGSVDVQYNGEVVGTAPVDDDGRWSFSWLLPAGFSAGGLGLMGRNRDGAEVESSSFAASANLGAAGLAAAGAAVGVAAAGLGGAFVNLINSQGSTIRVDDIDGDDLSKIWGIGPKTKLNFYRRGITTFEQFANIDPDTLSEVMAESRLMSARIPKDPHGSWTALAGLAAKGDWDGFNKLTKEIKPPEPARKKKRKPSVKLDGDKLSDIAGIGRGTWRALHGMGYNSYAKLADISVEEVEAAMKKSRALNAPGAPSPEESHASWTHLARLAAAGDWDAFNTRNAGITTAAQQTRFDALGYDFSGWEAGQDRSFYGKEAPGAVINFFYEGNQVGEAVAGEDGSWEFPFTVPEGFTPSLMTFTMS